jgi:hypothetical protein
VAEKNKQLLALTSVQSETAVRRNCADGRESVPSPGTVVESGGLPIQSHLLTNGPMKSAGITSVRVRLNVSPVGL